MIKSNIINFIKNLDIYFLLRKRRFAKGNYKYKNWNIEYVDSYSLWSSLDSLVKKKYNNFNSDNQKPFIIDCGANIGISILNYKNEYPKAKIIAFEPDPAIAKVLKRNLETNHATDVKIYEAAVWIKNGEMSFFCEGADGGKLVENPGDKQVTVKTVDLNDFLNENVDLLKIDIEGAELELIPHIDSNLKWVQNLIVECHFNKEDSSKFAELLTCISNAGFYYNINSMGVWRDLIHKPVKLKNEFDQYFLIAASKKQ